MKMDKSKIKEYREFLLNKENVTGVSRGFRVDEDGNVVSDEEVWVVTVKEKKDEFELASSDVVPKSIDGVDTIVRDFGDIKAQSESEVYKEKTRPLKGGVSFGLQNGPSGTLGVSLESENKFYLLSNNHVIADTNDAQIGSDLIQPASADSERRNYCGELERYVKIDFKENRLSKPGLFSKLCQFFKSLFGGGSSNSKIKESELKYNQVDCALGELRSCSTKINEVLKVGKIKGIRKPELGMPVRKVGRTSGVTEGQIVQMDATIEVGFSFGRKAMFEDQIITTPLSSPGDSGSVVLDEDNYLVGLLFSGSEKVTILNPIGLVFDNLNIDPNFKNA